MGSVRASAFGGTNSANTISTATLTPALGDLWVVIATQTGGSTSGANVTDTNGDPGGNPYVKIDEQTFTGGVMSIWVRQGFITSNTTSTDAIYSPGSGSTANELAVIAVSGMRATGASVVRQHGHNSGAAAATPSGTLSSVAVTTSVMILGLANTTNPAGVTGPGWSLLGNVGQAKPLGLEVHSKDSGFTASSIVYGGNSATDWATLLLELSATAVDGIDLGTPASFVYPRTKVSSFNITQTTGYFPPRSNAMMTFPVKQSTAITVPVFMRDPANGSGLAGLTLSVQSKKYGAAFATISPSVTDRGNGWYDVALTTSHTDTIGPMPLHITSPTALANDENIIDVVAVDKTDATRYGLTALPNANAGANTGLPVVGTQIPNATAGANNGLPVQGGAIPNANAGANTGLPVVGTQVPNATAGANNGLPVQGGAIPNANANAVGGLAVITAVGQGPGGQIKANSKNDKYVYDGSKRLTSCRIRVFANKTAADAATDGASDNAEGEVERYTVTCTYNTDGTLKTYEYAKNL